MNFASVPVVLLFVITMSANLIYSILMGFYSRKIVRSTADLYLYSAFCWGIGAVAVFFLMGARFEVSVYTVVLGIVFGLTICAQTVAHSAALTRGPFSYTEVIASMSSLVTVAAGILYWNEALRPLQVVGVALMVVCLVLSVKKDANERRANLMWLALALCVLVCSGAMGIMQKTHQTSTHKNEITAFLVIAFAVSCVFSALAVLFIRWKHRGGAASAAGEERRQGVMPVSLRILLGMVAVAGACAAVNHSFNLYLSGAVDAIIFFPIVNGGGLMLKTLASLFIFRERITARQWVGLASGAAATFLLGMQF